MRLIATFCLVTIVCLCAAPADARASEWSMEKWAKRESPWKGHGVGSTYTETTTTQLPSMPNMPNMPNMPGMPKDGKMVSTTKTTLTKITKDGYVLSIESTSMGRKTTRTSTEPKVRVVKLEGQVKDAGEQAITVAGKSYTCKVKTIANMEAFLGDAKPKAPGGRGGRGGSGQMGAGKVWEHAKLGVLKMETSTTMMGQTAKMTWQVSRLSASHTIGKQSYTGREMTMTMAHQMGTSKHTMLSSRTFPGGTLKSAMETAMMGRKMKSTTVVTAYTKKPLTATTPAAK